MAPELVTQQVSDTEFARQIGITPDLKPRLSPARKLLLAGALLLAGGTTLSAGLFLTGSATGSGAFQTGMTQCPMTGGTPQPGR